MDTKTFVKNRRRKIAKRKIKVTISIDEDLYCESGTYIYNFSGFVNNSLKMYLEKCKKKAEQLRITAIKESAAAQGIIIETAADLHHYLESKKEILSYDWLHDDKIW